MLKKVLVITGVALIGLSAKFAIQAYAGDGWEDPFDEANYWSPTTISWEDSAPSGYAMRDFGWNKGQVYDYTRHIKSILFGDDYKNIQNTDHSITNEDVINSTPLSANDRATTEEIVSQIEANTRAMRADLNIEDNKAFIKNSDIDDEFDHIPNYTVENKLRWLTGAYAALADSAKTGSSDTDNIIQNVDTLLSISNSVEGELQADQARNAMTSVSTASYTRLTEMISTLTKLKAIEQMNKDDNASRKAYFMNTVSSSPVDPYNKHLYEYMEDKLGYSRHTTNPMPDF